ncbi:MAG: FKBP-type peptidyl-prolyl cis-trans isomerase [Saccharospirillum sp.]
MTVKQGMVAGVAAAMMFGSAWAAALETDEQVASYGIGYGFAANLLQQTQGLELDLEALLAGVQAGFDGTESEISNERINAAIQALQEQQMAAQQEAQAASRAEGIAFLAENAERDGVTVTESGLQYEVLSSTDDGASPTAEDTVRVHYHGTLINGEVFDSSVDRGEPIEFPLSGVIAGWTEGVQLMTEGDKYKFFIPSDLAYGDNSPSPAIPAGSVLVFEVELLEVISN